MSITLTDLVELAGETAAEDVRQLTLRSHGITTFAPFGPHLPSLEGLSLSHNQLATLDGLKLLANLVTLNVNSNLLPSLVGLESCYGLQQLYAANNRVRDLRPLAGLTQLHTLNCMKNAISSLDQALQVLAGLPCLTDLDLSANPLSAVPNSKPLLVQHLPALQLLDGDRLTDLDRQDQPGAAAQPLLDYTSRTSPASFQAAAAQPPDILVLDAPAEHTQATSKLPTTLAASATAPHQDAPATDGELRLNSACTDGNDRGIATGAGLGGQPPVSGMVRLGSAGARPGTAGLRPATAGGYTQQLCSDPGLNDHPLLLEYLAKHVLAEGLAASGQSQPAAAVGSRLRGSFAARLRGTATAMAGTEALGVKDLAASEAVQAALPSTYPVSAVQELLRDATPQELIRQLVRLAEILIRELEATRQAASSGTPGCPSSRPSSTPSTSRATSCTATPAAAAGPQPAAARPSSAHLPATSNLPKPNHTNPTTGNASASPVASHGTIASTSASPQLPNQPANVTASTSCTSRLRSGNDPVVQQTVVGGNILSSMGTGAGKGQETERGQSAGPSALEEEVVRLRREVKQLQLENQNMYWLADEYKRLKAELAAKQGPDG